jgi:hypothetical protein
MADQGLDNHLQRTGPAEAKAPLKRVLGEVRGVGEARGETEV